MLETAIVGISKGREFDHSWTVILSLDEMSYGLNSDRFHNASTIAFCSVQFTSDHVSHIIFSYCMKTYYNLFNILCLPKCLYIFNTLYNILYITIFIFAGVWAFVLCTFSYKAFLTICVFTLCMKLLFTFIYWLSKLNDLSCT